MTFDGLLDLKDSRYDFHINVENADLNKLKFKDPIFFKGDVVASLWHKHKEMCISTKHPIKTARNL
jgi:hypothetical protein